MSQKVKRQIITLLTNALTFAVIFTVRKICYPRESLMECLIRAAGSWLGICLIFAVQRYLAKDRKEMETFAAEWTRRQKERQYPADGMMETEEKMK